MDIIANAGRGDPLFLRFQRIVIVILELDIGVIVPDVGLSRSQVVEGGLVSGAIRPGKVCLPISVVVAERLCGRSAIGVRLYVSRGIVGMDLGLAGRRGVGQLSWPVYWIVIVVVHVAVFVRMRVEVPRRVVGRKCIVNNG